MIARCNTNKHRNVTKGVTYKVIDKEPGILQIVDDMDVKTWWDWRDFNIVEEDKQDLVNSPNHYTVGGIETIDYIQAKLTKEEFNGYLKGNAEKYLSRHNHKGGIEDMKKCRWYLDKYIKTNESEGKQ